MYGLYILQNIRIYAILNETENTNGDSIHSIVLVIVLSRKWEVSEKESESCYEILYNSNNKFSLSRPVKFY